MQVNNIHTNQNFGMAMKISPDAQKILAKKIIYKGDIELLDKFVNAQIQNPFKVDIRNENGKLTAFISDTTKGVSDDQLKILEENFFEKHFKNSLAFIKRCCKTADKMNEETYCPRIDTELKNIFEKTK